MMEEGERTRCAAAPMTKIKKNKYKDPATDI